MDHSRRNKQAAEVSEECGWNSVCFSFLGREAPLPLLIQMTKVDKKSWRKEMKKSTWAKILSHQKFFFFIHISMLLSILTTYPETWGLDRFAGSMRSWWRCRWLSVEEYWRVWSHRRWEWTVSQQQLHGIGMCSHF